MIKKKIQKCIYIYIFYLWVAKIFYYNKIIGKIGLATCKCNKINDRQYFGNFLTFKRYKYKYLKNKNSSKREKTMDGHQANTNGNKQCLLYDKQMQKKMR